MLSVPYSVELNDIGLFIGKHLSGPDFVRIVKDQLDQFHEDAADSGRVMTLALHPFVIGQAFRYTYLDQALEYVADHPGVWLTTSDEIADHYARTVRPATDAGAGRDRADRCRGGRGRSSAESDPAADCPMVRRTLDGGRRQVAGGRMQGAVATAHGLHHP